MSCPKTEDDYKTRGFVENFRKELCIVCTKECSFEQAYENLRITRTDGNINYWGCDNFKEIINLKRWKNEGYDL